MNRFLHNPLIYRAHHHGLNADAIEELTSLFLRNNAFIWNGKIYRHVKGCPLNFPLSRLLFNIYLHYWQFTLRRSIRVANEFFGLYHHTGFLTWNQPIDKIQVVFDRINQTFDSPVHLTTSIGSQVHYLNSYIENKNGHLYTRVYYDPKKQPFLLPYFTPNPRLYHRQWYRFALLRAGLYCTHLEDFYDEQLYIELTFLANGYSLDYIEYHTRQFFRLMSPVIAEIQLDRYRYNALRMHLFRYQSGQKRKIIEERELQSNHQSIQLDYLFDWGQRWKFNAQFYKNWIEILEQDPKFKKYGLKIKLNSKHCYLSNTLLTHWMERI